MFKFFMITMSTVTMATILTTQNMIDARLLNSVALHPEENVDQDEVAMSYLHMSMLVWVGLALAHEISDIVSSEYPYIDSKEVSPPSLPAADLCSSRSMLARQPITLLDCAPLPRASCRSQIAALAAHGPSLTFPLKLVDTRLYSLPIREIFLCLATSSNLPLSSRCFRLC